MLQSSAPSEGWAATGLQPTLPCGKMGSAWSEFMVFQEVGNLAFNEKLFLSTVSVELNTSLIWPVEQLFPLIWSMDQRRQDVEVKSVGVKGGSGQLIAPPHTCPGNPLPASGPRAPSHPRGLSPGLAFFRPLLSTERL